MSQNEERNRAVALLTTKGAMSMPAKYAAAKLAVAECDKIDECKDWADRAMALAVYTKQSQDKAMEHMAMRIRARAIRRCGELLKEVGGAANQYVANARVGTGPSSRLQAATEAGMSKRQAEEAIRVANLDRDSFEAQVESDDPPSITELAEQGPIDQCTDGELLARADEFDKQATGLKRHARELRDFVARRRAGIGGVLS